MFPTILQYNIIQNTNELYRNTSHNMGSKIPHTISHNHIKIIGSKTQKHKNTKSIQFYQPVRIRASINPSNITIS